MTKKVNPEVIKFWNNENILVDTNIWLYIYGPEYVVAPKEYSNTFFNMLENGAKFYLNFSIISEFINRSTRLSYAAYLKSEGHPREEFDYKRNYRPTQHFKEHYDQAISNIQEILKTATVVQTNKESIENSVNHLSMLDFNDDIIIKDSLINNLNIFTADRDYLSYPDENLKIYCI